MRTVSRSIVRRTLKCLPLTPLRSIDRDVNDVRSLRAVFEYHLMKRQNGILPDPIKTVANGNRWNHSCVEAEVGRAIIGRGHMLARRRSVDLHVVLFGTVAAGDFNWPVQPGADSFENQHAQILENRHAFIGDRVRFLKFTLIEVRTELQ